MLKASCWLVAVLSVERSSFSWPGAGAIAKSGVNGALVVNELSLRAELSRKCPYLVLTYGIVIISARSKFSKTC